ncbi:hypothetical protein OROHE_023479 [Orobanche hederae]
MDSDSSDISWHDSDEDDDTIETSDSLGDDELGSGDEECQEARHNIELEKLRVPEIVEEGIEGEVGDEASAMVMFQGNCGLDIEGRKEMHSDYLDLDAEVDSESSPLLRREHRKGIGRLGFEATGNAYVHICDSTIYYQPGPGGGSSSSSIRRSTHAGSSEISTQESRAN